MQIPTQDQFADWLQLVQTPLAIRLPDYGEPITKAMWLEIATESGILWDRRKTELASTPVEKWRIRTREIERARDLVFRGNKKRNLSETRNAPRSVDAIADSVFSMAAEASSVPAEQHQFIRIHMNMFADGPFRHSWTVKCIEAIAEYFNPEMPRMIRDARSEAVAALEQARLAISRLQRSTATVSSLNLPDAKVRVRATFTKMLDSFTELSEPLNLPAEAFPISRLDARSSERLFVFRMYRANFAMTRGPRFEAIDELMSIEGFRHQYDRRTIERLCTEFSGKRQCLNARFTPGR